MGLTKFIVKFSQDMELNSLALALKACVGGHLGGHLGGRKSTLKNEMF